jgi:gas vesicle protein
MEVLMRDRDEQPTIIIEGGGQSGVGTFLLGALLGAGIALLLAPKSGAETQADLKARARRLRDDAEVRIRAAQAQIEDRLEDAREDLMDRVDQIRDAVESGRTTAHEARAELEEKLARSKAAYRAGVDVLRGSGDGDGDDDARRTDGPKPDPAPEGAS